MHKTPSVTRVAVLGDSAAAALHLPAEETFAAVAEDRLRACPGIGGPVEVLNFGVPGYGTAQELLQLQTDVRAFEPDLVLLAFSVENDVHQNAPLLDHRTDRPYLLPKNGQLSLAAEYRQEIQKRLPGWLARHSRLARLLLGYFHQNEDWSTAALEGDNDPAVYREPEELSPWEEAWGITALLLAAMRDEARSQGATMAIVLPGSDIQTHPDSAVRDAFREEHGIDDLFLPDLQITSLALQENIPVLALSPVLQAEASETGAFFHGNPQTGAGKGPLNTLGHRRAGEMIAEFLCGTVIRR